MRTLQENSANMIYRMARHNFAFLLLYAASISSCAAFAGLSKIYIERRRLLIPSMKENKATTDLSSYRETMEKIQQTAAKWRRQDLFGNSLVEQTVKDMGENVNTPLTKEERTARRRALDALDIPSFSATVRESVGDGALHRKVVTVLQINVGLYCNQACGHCHVESSPLRTTEMMTAETAAQCLKLLAVTPSITTLDITGGAPELNSSFRYLVSTARELRPDIEIIDRCNLTVLQEPGQEDLVDFLKNHGVSIVASLPCYTEGNVDQQRGKGVFERSIAALLALNDAGFGVENGLPLHLVYNPSGGVLPGPQAKLQDDYKTQLADNFGILFNQLFTITNMPIKRFADFLHRRHELTDYMSLLVRNFNPNAVEGLMCRDTVSVRYDGTLFDCDFNQQLGMGMANGALTVFDIENLGQLQEYDIKTANHCFGCTAGMGSSCGGALV